MLNVNRIETSLTTAAVAHWPLLVYGSLRRGYWNHPLLQDWIHLGNIVLPRHRMFVFSETSYDAIPFVVSDDACETGVACEVYAPPSAWASSDGAAVYSALDALEGHPSFYTRTGLNLIDGDRNSMSVYAYLMGPRRASTFGEAGSRLEVPSGDWAHPETTEHRLDVPLHIIRDRLRYSLNCDGDAIPEWNSISNTGGYELAYGGSHNG